MKRFMIGIIAVVMLVTVSQMHAVRYGVKKQVPTGFTGPQVQYLGFSKLSNRMYCGANSYNALLAINCANDSSMGLVPGSFMIGPTAYNATSDRLYMKGMDEFCAIDCAINTEDTTVGGFQGGLAIEHNPDNGKIYVYDEFSGLTSIYATSNYAYLGGMPDFGGPMVYNQPNNSVYIPHYSADSLGVFSGATNGRIASIPVPNLASGNKRMGANPAGNRLYAALSATDRVAIVNTATNALLSSPLVGDNPAGFALCPVNGKMFVACNGSSSRSLYTIDLLGAVDSVAVGDSISAVVYNPSDSMVYCADYNNGYVRIVDPRGAMPVVIDSVYLGMTFARPLALSVDNGGDVYVAASGLDWVPVVGIVPSRMWRSMFSGFWFDYMAWQYSDDGGSTWGNVMTTYPSGPGDSTIIIQAGHTIQQNIGGPAVIADQLVVDGTLAQLDNSLTIADGPGADMIVNGVYQYYGGAFALGPGATMAVGPGGQYLHGVNGGTVPAAQWDPQSWLLIEQVQDSVPAGLNQSFGIISWNCPDQIGDAVLPGGPGFALRGLSVYTTSAGRLFLTSPAVPNLTINGGLSLQSSSDVVLGGGGTRSVTVNGDFTVYDPAWMQLTDSASHGVSILYLRGDYSHLVSGIAGGGPDSTTIVFCGTDIQNYYANGEALTGYINYRVDPGSFLAIPEWCQVGQGSLGWFTLMPGATLGMTDYEGLYPAGQNFGPVRVGGARNYSQNANYAYYSLSTGPYPTGPGMPDTVRQLIIESSGDAVVLTKNLAVKDTLKLVAGPLRIGDRRLSLLGALYWGGGDLQADSTSRLAVLGSDPAPVFISAGLAGLDTLVLDRAAGIDLGAPLPIRGAFVQSAGKIHTNWLQYGPGAELIYNKPGPDTTSVNEFPVSSGPRNVTVSTAGPLYLHEDRTVPGTLSLSSGALATGAYTVTIDSFGMVSRTAGFVAGNLRRYVWTFDTMVTYDLGTTASGYTPTGLRPFNTAAAGFLSVGISGQPHPMTSNSSACLRKYWSLSSQTLVTDSCRLTFNYTPSDFNPPNFTEAAHETAMAAGRYGHGAAPGWAGPAITTRNAGGSGDGGSIVLSHSGSFPDSADFTLGRDTMALWAPYDSTAPIAPQNLLANGSNPSWWYGPGHVMATVSWDNPADPAGIAKAYYKLGSAPTGNGDFTDTVRAGIGGASDTIGVSIAGLNGINPLHIWLEDGSGNADYNNHATVDLRRDTDPPTGVAVLPFSSDTISSGSFTVYWSRGSDALSGLQAYRLLCQIDTAGAPWDTFASFTTDTFYSIEVLTAGYLYRFEAAGCDSAYNWETLTGTPEQTVFVRDSFDITPPTVTVIAPDTGALWQNQTWRDIVWSALDDVGLVRRELYYRTMPASSWVAIDTLYGAGSDPDTFSWFVPYVLGAQAQIKVVAFDGAGNWGADSSGFFTIADTIRPWVLSLAPVSGDTAVAITEPVQVTFSEPMADTSLQLTCNPTLSGWIPQWSAGHDTVMLSHSQFVPGTQYTVTITGARDRGGNQLTSAVWTIFRAVRPQTVSTPWQGGRYKLMSIPAIPVDSTAAGLLGASLGAYGSANWRMFDYDAQLARYIENPAVHNGRSYWLSSVNSATLNVSCSPNIAAQTVLTMEPGWNLVGDPYGSALAVGGLEVSADTGALRSYSDSSFYVNDNLLRQRMWTYSDTTYDLVNNGRWDSLSPFNPGAMVLPWGGYAVYAVSPCDLHFMIAKKPGPGKAPPPAEIRWQVTVDAVNGLGADRGLVMGISPQASAGYDRLDAEKPPLVSSQITAEIPHPEWNQGPCDVYHYDFRPPAGYLEWPLRLRQSDQESRASLLLTPSGSLPVGQRAYLVDRKRGTALEIAGPTTVGFTGSGEFAIVCSDRAVGGLNLKPLAFGMDRLAPNPCAGAAAISYQLPRSGTVSLKVYNVAGQLVRTLVGGRQDAGYYDVRWDGLSDNRLAASSGLYLVRLSWGSEARTQKLIKLE